LSSELVAATCYYNENVLTTLDLWEDIHWLFGRGAMGQFRQTRDHTYRDLTLGF